MAKGARGKKVTLKMARSRLQVTADGRRCLNLSNLGLSSFPPCVFQLAPLDELDLSRNQLRSLPVSLSVLSGLVTLDLHTNQLEALSEDLGSLVALESLNVANNQLDESGLPTSLGTLPALRSLNLGLNRLRDLPPALADLASLRHLALFDNLLERVPECVSTLQTQLDTLNLQRNPLTANAHANARRNSALWCSGGGGRVSGEGGVALPALLPLAGGRDGGRASVQGGAVLGNDHAQFCGHSDAARVEKR
ncbi:leucine-rich repeat-containing protein 18 [Alosa alosa]|uniref:leucine-rich repeat-containing protein 18 n=1 Tax=Alosa alosa TaxID=278164 RepID=UPI00201545A5|nr:leucine-rich repeat-containing protein 18 [Alosa alosa]XP_048124913.1 leucine-rich repeat-containing protein 18 [Alosa alosa]